MKKLVLIIMSFLTLWTSSYGEEKITVIEKSKKDGLLILATNDPRDLNDSNGTYKDELPEPYRSDLNVLGKIYEVYNQNLKKLLEIMPEMKKGTIKNAITPYILSFDAPDELRVWAGHQNMQKVVKILGGEHKGYKMSVNLKEGSVSFEVIENDDDLSINNYHLIYGFKIIDGKMPELTNALYIGMQCFNINMSEVQIKEFIIPKQIRYIDRQGFNFYGGGINAGGVNVIAEESDAPLLISHSGILTHDQSNKFEFNRPVFICDYAMNQSKVKELIFNKEVEYLGKHSFKNVEEIKFKECPGKMAEYILSLPNKRIQRAYVPSNSLIEFKRLGTKNIDTIIGTK